MRRIKVLSIAYNSKPHFVIKCFHFQSGTICTGLYRYSKFGVIHINKIKIWYFILDDLSNNTSSAIYSSSFIVQLFLFYKYFHCYISSSKFKVNSLADSLTILYFWLVSDKGFAAVDLPLILISISILFVAKGTIKLLNICVYCSSGTLPEIVIDLNCLTLLSIEGLFAPAGGSLQLISEMVCYQYLHL